MLRRTRPLPSFRSAPRPELKVPAFEALVPGKLQANSISRRGKELEEKRGETREGVGKGMGGGRAGGVLDPTFWPAPVKTRCVFLGRDDRRASFDWVRPS